MAKNDDDAAGRPRGGAPAQERELRAQGKKTMRKLLDAGKTVFADRGFHAARVDDIVKVAKTSHGTFYLYFSNKEDLLRALIDAASEEMVALAETLPDVEKGSRGHDALREWLDRFTDLYEEHGAVVRTWIEAETRSNDFALVGAEVLGGFSAALAKRIEAADTSGALDPGIAAVAFVAMIERFFYIRAAMGRMLPFDRDATLDTLTTIIHAGVFGGQRRKR
jgi:AcrR family transcriptional regulator